MPTSYIKFIETERLEKKYYCGTKSKMLNINKKLFTAFQKAKIQYCHWKSNEHLAAGLAGNTDLDILVGKNSFHGAKQLLRKAGFKLFKEQATLGYAGLEHWIAMDPGTRKLTHIHLHEYLRLGEKHLKGYILPWESIILTTTTRDPASKVAMCDPNLELILLLTRSALKIRARDYLLWLLGQLYFSKNDRREFTWLKERTDSEKISTLAQKLLGKKAAQLIPKLRLSLFSLIKLRMIILPRLKLHKQYNFIDSILTSWKREYIWLTHKINQRFIHHPITTGLHVGEKGRVIACTGTDGSGKSTITKELVKWLSWKFNPIPIYFGSGQGTISLLRWPIKLLASLFFSKGSGNVAKVYKEKNRFNPIKKMGLVCWALLLAREKKNKLRKMIKARNSGMLVICDRFPQKNVRYLSDGPLLLDDLRSNSILLRMLAEWEFKSYVFASDNPPDLIIRLNVSPAEAMKRKNDISLHELKQKNAILKTLEYGASTKIVDIDANKPLAEVIKNAKSAVWKTI